MYFLIFRQPSQASQTDGQLQCYDGPGLLRRYSTLNSLPKVYSDNEKDAR